MSAQNAYQLFHELRKRLGRASLRDEERSEIFRYLNAIESSYKRVAADRDEWQSRTMECVAVLAGLAPKE